MNSRRTRPAPGPQAPHSRRLVPELLAPAGDAASLAVALQCGADAVYFGLQEGFNARARAGNFGIDSLPGIVETIHRAGARAYLAVNTLVFEPELAHVESVLRAAAGAGVDAILVQDPAVALLARRVAPSVALHASTQMTISSAEAAVFARDIGAVRAVLPRELSVDEIAAFLRGAGLEAEVFVHGALCVSWSGQCLTSEAWGGRSANRGQCAQSCRMPYDLVVDGRVRDLGEVRYLLSPKDLAGARLLPRLVEIGVHGLKIEGRQKGAEYVATAVQGYRRWLDAVAEGREADAEAEHALRDDLRAMALAFSRGFGDGFLAGGDHQALVDGRFPKHRGIYLGRVKRVERKAVVVAAETFALSPGMGVVFDAGEPEDTHEPGGPVFAVEKRGRELVLRFGRPGPDLGRVTAGQRVWVTSDPAIAQATERLLRLAPRERKQRLDLAVVGKIGAPLRITGRALDADGATVLAQATVETASAAAPAAGGGLDAAILEEKLCALGGTSFAPGALDIEGLAPGMHIPVSELKAARRALLEQLSGQLSAARSQTGPAVAPPLPEVQRPRFQLADLSREDPAPRLVPLCRSAAQLQAVIEAGLPEVELDWMELVGLAASAGAAREAGLQVTLATLRVQKPGEEPFDRRLAKLAPDGVLVRHWGALVAFARRREKLSARGATLRLHGDFSLNVTNSMTAHHLFGWGLDTLTAAHDLDETQLFAMLEHVPAARITVVVHHRIPTFHTEHCVYAHLLSDGRDSRSCGRPCERHEVSLRDHLGRAHPVIVDAGCRNTVFNSRVQSAARLVPRLLAAGVRRFRIEFVRESTQETASVLAAYQALLAGRMSPDALLDSLRLAAQQGVSTAPMQLLR